MDANRADHLPGVLTVGQVHRCPPFGLGVIVVAACLLAGRHDHAGASTSQRETLIEPGSARSASAALRAELHPAARSDQRRVRRHQPEWDRHRPGGASSR